MIDLTAQKETATKAARGVSDSTVEFAGKAKDLGMSSAKSATDSASEYLDMAMDAGLSASDAAVATFKILIERMTSFADIGIERVSDVQVGQKNVGERMQATVDTVEEKIDVDQIQEQVSVLRDQMEHVLVSWKDSFRPAASMTEVATEPAPVKKATTTTKAAPKKAPVKKATTTTKAAPKKAPVKKASTAKKTTTKTATKK
jgi:hypothetical protein